MVMIKNRDADDSWFVYHFGGWHGAGPAYNYATSLDTNSTHVGGSTHWNSTHPAATVFSIGTHVGVNTSSEKYIAYCFHSVPNMTRVSTYRGNQLADGFYVWTGFAPAFVMTKQNAGTGNWVMIDNKRSTYNPSDEVLYADVNDVEASPAGLDIDFLSNGYKMRGTHANINDYFYIAIAFAATPFKYANAQ